MNRTPHFFKLSSRLGLVHPPVAREILNIGVEDAPSAILTDEYLGTYPSHSVTEYVFSAPEEYTEDHIWDAITHESAECMELIRGVWDDREVMVAVGGDHSVSFCTLGVLAQRFSKPQDIAVIYLDSHGDINRISDSPSGNWHGMYLRPVFCDDFEDLQVDALIERRLPLKNLLYIGNLDLDGGEPAFFQTNHISTIDIETLRTNPAESMKRVSQLIMGRHHIHVSVDVDAFDSTVAPATGLPAASGLLMEDVEDVIGLIKTAGSYSLDVVEVNPRLPGAEPTIALARRIIDAFLK